MFCVPYTERFKNNFGLKFVQTNFSVFKIDNLKTLKLFWLKRLMGYQSIPSNLSFCYLSSIKFISLNEEKFVMKKTCSILPYTERFQNNFGLKFVQTNFSVFKIDNFKNTKIILALSRALDGILKVSHQILVSAICRAWQSRQIKLFH